MVTIFFENIEKKLFKGAYVPLTMEGNIMVDGVLASCYPSVHHDLAHIGMLPIRWFPEMFMWIFGDDNGLSVFVKFTEDLGKWVLPNEKNYK